MGDIRKMSTKLEWMLFSTGICILSLTARISSPPMHTPDFVTSGQWKQTSPLTESGKDDDDETCDPHQYGRPDKCYPRKGIEKTCNRDRMCKDDLVCSIVNSNKTGHCCPPSFSWNFQEEACKFVQPPKTENETRGAWLTGIGIGIGIVIVAVVVIIAILVKQKKLKISQYFSVSQNDGTTVQSYALRVQNLNSNGNTLPAETNNVLSGDEQATVSTEVFPKTIESSQAKPFVAPDEPETRMCRSCHQLIGADDLHVNRQNLHWHATLSCSGHDYRKSALICSKECVTNFLNQPSEHLSTNVCLSCGELIGGEDAKVTWQNLHWHATSSCFRCVQCKSSLLDVKITVQDEKAYCSKKCVAAFLQQQALENAVQPPN